MSTTTLCWLEVLLQKNSFFLHCPIPTSRLIFSEWQARKFASASVCKSICQSQDSDFYSAKAVVANPQKHLSVSCCQLCQSYLLFVANFPSLCCPQQLWNFLKQEHCSKLSVICIDVRSNVIWARINDRKQIFNLRYTDLQFKVHIFWNRHTSFSSFGDIFWMN